TFTKGIGTPTYMAPEILMKEKYKKNADVFSFAITMFECFGWCEAYTKDLFKFPWKIAEYVIAGNRPIQNKNIKDNQYELICECWKQNPIERITIETIIQKLETLKDN
ncbi:tyrosine kinase, putative, partial [Entamoeba invadens IP1]